MDTEDFFITKLRTKVATWTARAETAQRAGNTFLFQKAEKYRERYEKELREMLALLRKAEVHPRGLPVGVCSFCYIQENIEIPYFLDEPLLPLKSPGLAVRELDANSREDLRDALREFFGPDERQNLSSITRKALEEPNLCLECRQMYSDWQSWMAELFNPECQD